MDEQFELYPKVLTRIAKAFDENVSMKKTPLFRALGISWKRFHEYIGWMESNNFIECKINGKKRTYALTESGREMLSRFVRFLECTKSNRLTVVL